MQEFRQYQCILQSHRAALTHHRRTSVRGISDEHDPTVMPVLKLKPFNRAAMNRVVVRQSPQMVLDKAAEPNELMAQALQPPGLGIAKAWRRHICEAISAASDRAKSEEAASPSQN